MTKINILGENREINNITTYNNNKKKKINNSNQL